ncbi:hypothetical protein K440DRAFT_7276 [Wilcoxina mikolae CBS 423.85]|nr:hypothetical protein K440DRAFT_7276 [Wilcoxina mikolae CBS 423.85]
MSEHEPKAVRLEICPYADMKIALKTSAVNLTYLVSSIQLRCGSSYFRAMLGPHYAEGDKLRHSTNTTATINTTPTPEDSEDSLLEVSAEDEFNPIALATVLYVLHSRPENIPRSITSENLLDIAIICNYYDCAEAMRPWDELWIRPLRGQAIEAGYEYWLFIAWVFVEGELFAQLTKIFMTNGVIVEEEFGVLVEGKLVRMDCHLPQGIIV